MVKVTVTINAIVKVTVTIIAVTIIALSEYLRYLLGMRASTRTGPPEPPSIFIGKAKTSAPVGGNLSRFVRFYRLLTLRAAAMRCTRKSSDFPKSVDAVSTPSIATFLSSTSKRAASSPYDGN